MCPSRVAREHLRLVDLGVGPGLAVQIDGFLRLPAFDQQEPRGIDLRVIDLEPAQPGSARDSRPCSASKSRTTGTSAGSFTVNQMLA